MSACLIGVAMLGATGCGRDGRALTPEADAGAGGAEAAGGAEPAGGAEASGGAEPAGGAGSNGGAPLGGAGSPAAGADAGGAPGGKTIDFSQNRLYQHLHQSFTTLEECQAAQRPDSFINCYQQVEFCSDGSAVIVLTDVQELGTYVVNDDHIDASWIEPFDAPDHMRFTIVSPQHLTDDIVGWDWLLAEDMVDNYCPEP